jgi:site-specific DNA-methyltransferase (adenine-specific)
MALVEGIDGSTAPLDSQELRAEGGQLPAAREGGVMRKSGSGASASPNTLYYGDNLDILKNKIKDESVDLIYLDPPFKSGTNYNLLFQAAGLDAVGEQVEAFKDTWKWGESSERAYDEVRNYGKLGLALSGIRKWLGDRNEMMAYLAMMAVRLVHMQHKLKPSGSIFLHCDPVASHYLKILLDALFGGGSFQNEIIWSYRRWPTKASRLQRMHDVILFYSIDPEQAKFNIRYQDPTESSKKRWKGKKQNVTFDLLGHRNPTAELSEESVGVPLNDVWQIPVIAPVSKERLGYPTQKPLRLLQQIIDVASDPGDLILDPFCGCGTAVDAAEMLGREWIGIDIAHYAVTLIEERLARWRPGATYEVFGRPTTLAGARDLAQRDKFQFEWWAAWLLGGRATRKKARMMALMGE